MFLKPGRKAEGRTNLSSAGGQSRSPRLGIERLEDRSLPSAAFVLEWNSLLLNVQQVRNVGNQQAARGFAMMNGAIYDSVNAIHPTHTVYHTDARTFPNVSSASPDAAAAQAAHDIAYALQTNADDRSLFDQKLSTQLGTIDSAEAIGIELGKFVAASILSWRTGDGSATPPVVTYTIGNKPGDWQPTPPANNPIPATPWWPNVTPFALDTGDQFRPGPPPPITSAAFAEAYNEVKTIGSLNSSTRTPEQTEIALFWSGLVPGGSVSNAGVGIWSQITQTVASEHHLSLAENARLFAQVSVANADAFIASFDAKYEYNFWRPVTAIRAGDTDGNPATAPDATWSPLFATPNHPSYGSNHSTQSRAAAEALAAFFDTDHVSFSATWNGVERSFNKFTDAAKEAGKSRVFAGIHWSFDSAAGEQLGRKVGRFVADHYFLPLTGSNFQPKAVQQLLLNAGGELGPATPVGGLALMGAGMTRAETPGSSWNAPATDTGIAAVDVDVPPLSRPSSADWNPLDDFVIRIDNRVLNYSHPDEWFVGSWAEV